MSEPTCGYHCANPVTWHLTTDCGCIDQHVCEQHATMWFQLRVLMAGGKGLWCCECRRDIQVSLEEVG